MDAQAVVFVAPNRVELRTLEVPPPGPNQVQIRTDYSVISAGTEGWALANRFTWASTPFPCVPGYQRVGTITALGAGVENWHVGERVFATTGEWLGATAPFWGAHLSLANSSAREVYRLPNGIHPIDAAAAVIAQVGYNAASRLTLQHDDWVAVYGDGLIGQFAAQAARARGARVVLVGHRDERLEAGARWSADAVVNNHDAEAAAVVRQITSQQHVAAVLDSVQQERAQVEYMPLLEHGKGQIVYCGFTPGTVWADMAQLQQQEVTAHFVSGWNRTRLDATLALLAERRLQLRPIVTHHVPFSQAPAMYAMINAKTEPFLGIVLDWSNA